MKQTKPDRDIFIKPTFCLNLTKELDWLNHVTPPANWRCEIGATDASCHGGCSFNKDLSCMYVLLYFTAAKVKMRQGLS